MCNGVGSPGGCNFAAALDVMIFSLRRLHSQFHQCTRSFAGRSVRRSCRAAVPSRRPDREYRIADRRLSHRRFATRGNSTFVARTFSRFEARTRSVGLLGCEPPDSSHAVFACGAGGRYRLLSDARLHSKVAASRRGSWGQAGVAVHGGRVSAVLAQLGFTRRGWRSPPLGLLPQNAGQGEGQG